MFAIHTPASRVLFAPREVPRRSDAASGHGEMRNAAGQMAPAGMEIACAVGHATAAFGASPEQGHLTAAAQNPPVAVRMAVPIGLHG